MVEYEILFTINVEGTENIANASSEVSNFSMSLESASEASSAQAMGIRDQISGFTDFGMALGGVVNAMQFYEMWTLRMDMSQQTLEARQMSLENAQMNYNDAVTKYGPASEQAIKAHNNLERAQLYLTRTQERLNMVQYRMYFEILPVGISVISSVAKMYDMLVPAQEAATVGQEELNASMATGIALEDILTFGAAAVAGALIGYAAASYISGASQSAASSVSSSTAPSLQVGEASGVPFTGLYHLGAGERVTSPIGEGPPGIAGTSPASSGGIGSVSIHLDANARDLLRVTAVEYEYENQRRGPMRY